ncbi:MAG TPA: FAD-dependent oxidoreductase [Gemmatimonadales bacterium]|jgi:protoporphyrinogen oxidase
MAERPRVIILGAGPAGVGGAYALTRDQRASVTVLEAQRAVGGNAGSFEWEGQRLDFGSHRLHPATRPEILADIKRLLGDDLLDRPRHGRILLRGRWIHFPLKPVDLLLKLPNGFAAGSMRDAVVKTLAKPPEGDSFASVLLANLGPTICRDFYFPYARKIWGREPEELSAIQARRRVSAGSFLKLARKVLSAVPGLKPPGAGRFWYPRRGYGQISEAYAAEAVAKGADLQMGWRVSRVARASASWTVTAEQGSERREWTAEHVWSTLPISLLARMVDPAPPAAVSEAASAMSFRAMILVYLRLDVPQFTEFDAHYLPSADIAITRLSEPKNYAVLKEPAGHTVLCAELPCSPGDKYWEMDDAALGRLVADDLARAGLPLARPPVGVLVRRLKQAYPIYLTGYERPFGVLDAWAESLPNLLTYGRQGLFAHDNTHHALYMAYCAAECLSDAGFDMDRWRRYREIFATHVVED